MFSCFTSDNDHDQRQPLLSQYNDDTGRQAALHEKLHTYQMLRAMSKGYMPSSKQVNVQLRTLLSSQFLNPSDTVGLSSSGRALVRTSREWLELLIKLVDEKNCNDQIQDFLWYLTSAKVDVNTDSVASILNRGQAQAKISTAAQGLQTVFSLALLNNDFRVLVADLGTITKQVLRDSAFAVAEASTDAGKQLDADIKDSDLAALKETDEQAQGEFSKAKLKEQAQKVQQDVQGEAAQVGEQVYTSLRDHLSEEAQQVLIGRLKAAVSGLRQRKDYSQAISQVAELLQRCVTIYLSAAGEAAEEVEENLELNQHARIAATNFWGLISSFGDENRWNHVSDLFRDFIDKNHENKENTQQLVQELITMVQKMLSDPDFLDNFGEKKNKMQKKISQVTNDSTLGNDISELVNASQSALESAMMDATLQKLTSSTMRLANILFPSNQKGNSDLFNDFANVFLPLVVQGVQHFPIPRLEVATPSVDLLLENLILEPGKTVNHSSFLPYNLHVTNKNDIDVTKARFGTTSTMTNVVTIKAAGISIAAQDLGYWMRVHSGLLRFVDEGLAGFYLDERGIDVTVELEIGRDRIEELVVLRKADVQIHHLNYSLRKSKFACLGWFLKPLLRPILRRALASAMSSAIGDGVERLNRELVFARERLRAARVCDPDSMWTFIRAVASRFTWERDPNVSARVGLKPGKKNVFRGRYAPGSLVRLWEREAEDAQQTIHEYRQDGWRNEIFDVKTVPA